MQVKIYWEWDKSTELMSKVTDILEELGLFDFIKIEKNNSVELKEELWIKESPALIIEEEAIDFKDVIFEGIIPSDDELKSMFTSIIWGWDTGGSCGLTEADWSCWSWCAC